MSTQFEYNWDIGHLEAQVKKKDKQLQEKDRKIQELEIKLNDQQLQLKKHGTEIETLKKQIENLRVEKEELKREKEKLTSKVKELEETLDDMTDIHILYIAQIGYMFAKQAYHFVLGEPMYKKYDLEYYMTHLEQIIEEIQDDDQRKQARENWKVLQEKVKWQPQMGKDLHNLRRKRIPAAHPPDLQKWKAQEFIDKLDKKGKLRRGFSKHTLETIVRMWEISCNLVPDN